MDNPFLTKHIKCDYDQREKKQGGVKTKVRVLKPFADAEGKLRDVGAVLEINSTLGIDIVAKGFAEEVKEAPPKEAAKVEADPKAGAEIKDLSEIVPKLTEVEGEQRTVEELVGKVIVLEKFGLKPSQYGDRDYATVQITEENGAKAWFNTGSGPILDTLKQVEGSLPVRCKIEQRKSEKGRRYFALAGTKQG